MAKGLLIAIGKPKGESDDHDTAGDDDGGGAESEAAGHLAELLELPEDKHDAFKRALDTYVAACVDKALDEGREAKE